LFLLFLAPEFITNFTNPLHLAELGFDMRQDIFKIFSNVSLSFLYQQAGKFRA